MLMNRNAKICTFISKGRDYVLKCLFLYKYITLRLKAVSCRKINVFSVTFGSINLTLECVLCYRVAIVLISLLIVIKH